MTRTTQLFLGLVIFCLVLTLFVYFWFYPEELPTGGITIFSHPENAG